MSETTNIEFGATGAVIIEFFSGPIISHWLLRRKDGNSVIDVAKGSNDDAIPDVVSLDPATLDGTTYLWTVLLFGPDGDTPYTVTVPVMQAGVAFSGTPRVVGNLPARAAKQVTGTINFQAKV